jgi:hypothetical protein
MQTIDELIKVMVEKTSSENFNFLEASVDNFSVNEFIEKATEQGFIFNRDLDNKIARDVKTSGEKVDYSSKGGFFDYHTDGLSNKIIPKYVFMYCVNTGELNTPTVLVDSIKLAKLILGNSQTKMLEKCEVTYVDKLAQEHTFPLICYNKTTPYLTFASRGFVRPKINKDNLMETPSLRELSDSLNKVFLQMEDCIIYDKNWETGKILLFNNLYCLHGRPSNEVSKGRYLFRFLMDT